MLQKILPYIFIILSLFACNSSRHLAPDQTMLSEVKMVSDTKNFKVSTYRNIVRQEPNTKWFNIAKVPLGIYSISNPDTTKRRGWNNMLRRIGEAPVVYDSTLTAYSRQAITEAMRSKGYLHAATTTSEKRVRHKLRLSYHLTPNARYYIDSLAFCFDSRQMEHIVMEKEKLINIKKGMPLDYDVLGSQRNAIIKGLRQKGYYALNKEFISFSADTIVGETGCILTLHFSAPEGVDTLRAYRPFRFGRVAVRENDVAASLSDASSPLERDADIAYSARSKYASIEFLGKSHPMLWRNVYAAHISTMPDSLYSDEAIQYTYGALGALPPVSYSTIRLTERPDSLQPNTLDCNILIHPAKPHTVSAEVEGTNTAGDLGVALALSYANRNLFRGAEMLSLKVRGAYEAIKGLEGYNNENYVEWSGEMGLNFPTLLMPGISRSRKRELKASSTAGFLYDSQNRPEFHRRVLTGAWVYKWQHINQPKWRHRFDVFSLNYVYMPYISETFRNEYLEGDDPHYSVLRYSYTNLFIMRSAYSVSYNSLRSDAPTGLFQTNGLQFKANVEVAGNVLYGLSKFSNATKSADGYYEFLGIAYSQYAKFDVDLSKSYVLNERNSLAFHIGFGIAQPYGNSTILPYEKRYFAGGANGVRGWSVRTLGPGGFKGQDGRIDFINHTGNVKLESSIELRTTLFGKLHGALFVDAGNIWNTRNYPDQPDGLFRFDSFYKQIAVAYGLGLRLNFDYFIIRLDGGMKAVNPAYSTSKEHYPLLHPSFSRDFTFHFAVGLPF